MHSDSHSAAARAGTDPSGEETDEGVRTERGDGSGGLRSARRAFLGAAGFTSGAAPWLLGGEPVVAEWVLLVGAILTAVTGFRVRALCVRTYSGRSAWKVEQLCLACGALLLVLMLSQALNPAFRVEVQGETSRLVPLNPIPWLPQSIADAFDGGGPLPVFRNAWRYLLIFGTGWLYVAGLAAGFRERENARSWARLMGVNAALLAAVSLLHAATGSKLAWWVFAGGGESGAGAVFLQKSQEGAYLAALLALVCGLAMEEKESRRRRRTWEVLALVLWGATLLADPRIATACASGWLIIYWWLRREKRWHPSGELGVSGAWFLGAAVTAAAVSLIFTMGSITTEKTADGDEHELVGRNRAEVSSLHEMEREVGLAMWVDRPITGWGGGAYPTLFVFYGEKVVSMATYLHSLPPGKARPQSASARSDVVEFLVEYGVCGLVLLLAIFGAHLHGWIYWRGWSEPLASFLIAGSVGLVIHAGFDSILRTPAPLFLFSGLQIAAVRLAAPSKGKKPGRVRRSAREMAAG